jgi:tRNA 2-thiouridine synthesizing protein A
MDASMSDLLTVDTKGMKCPLPVLKARKALKTLAPGARMQVLATDPGAIADFKHFCKTTGARLIEQREEAGGVLVFLLEKAA